MNKHPELLAKGVRYGSTTLLDHLNQVGQVASMIAKHIGMDENIARNGGLLHDAGKVHPLFQKSLHEDKKKHQSIVDRVLASSAAQHPRHEIASMCFLRLFPKEQWPPLIDMVIGHHKSIRGDRSDRGLLDFAMKDDIDQVFSHHTQDWETWSPKVIDILEALGIPKKDIAKDQAIETLHFVLNYCKSKQAGMSKWRGLLMAADHFASALEDGSEIPQERLFSTPNLGKFDRPNNLYSLSLVDASDQRLHTIVTAPTGAGKTDFLMRRCRGRVFYTLPFQASINAMHDRFQTMLPPGTDLRVKHAASKIIASKSGAQEEGALQSLVGAGIKITTPHQLASLILGTHAYEATAIDLENSDVILDEIHVYSEQTLSMVVELVRMLLRLNCRVHIGTATMPSDLYHKLRDVLGGSEQVYEVKLDDKKLSEYDRHIVYKHQSFDELDQVIQEAIANGEKLLVVVNRVDRSQEIYEQLKQQYSETAKLLLLHSRFKRSDRSILEEKLHNEFNNMNTSCIVVATQVVEVSLDISFDRLITECAPLDSMIQRFGRINRKRSVETIGRYKSVHVIAPPEKQADCWPYNIEVLQKSFSVLEDGMVLKETEVLDKIDQVYPEIGVPEISVHTIWDGDTCKLKELTHRSKSLLAQFLDIDAVSCIVESDKNDYIRSPYDRKADYEFSLSWRSTRSGDLQPYFVKDRQLTKIGSRPFVLPNHFYDQELGFRFRTMENIF